MKTFFTQCRLIYPFLIVYQLSMYAIQAQDLKIKIVSNIRIQSFIILKNSRIFAQQIQLEDGLYKTKIKTEDYTKNQSHYSFYINNLKITATQPIKEDDILTLEYKLNQPQRNVHKIAVKKLDNSIAHGVENININNTEHILQGAYAKNAIIELPEGISNVEIFEIITKQNAVFGIERYEYSDDYIYIFVKEIIGRKQSKKLSLEKDYTYLEDKIYALADKTTQLNDRLNGLKNTIHTEKEVNLDKIEMYHGEIKKIESQLIENETDYESLKNEINKEIEGISSLNVAKNLHLLYSKTLNSKENENKNLRIANEKLRQEIEDKKNKISQQSRIIYKVIKDNAEKLNEIEKMESKSEGFIQEVVQGKKNNLTTLVVFSAITLALILLLIVSVFLSSRIKKQKNKLSEKIEEINIQKQRIEQQAIDLQEKAEELSSSEEELKQNIEALALTNRQLEALQLAKDQQANQIVHDFKTPLKHIIDYCQFSFESNSLAELNKNIGIIYKSAKRIDRLAKNILEIQKFKKAEMSLIIKTNNLFETVEEALSYFDISFAQKKINVYNQVPITLNALFDKEKILRVMDNLIANALKHTEENGMLLIYADDFDEQVKISVKDTGKGIPSEIIDKIFGEGISFDYSTGFGLSFCDACLKAHNKQIGVVSELGKGTEFYFYLDKSSTDLLPTSVDKKNHQKKISLSDEDKIFLMPFITEIKQFEFYENSNLENVLLKISPNDVNIDIWKNAALEALEKNIETKFLELIDIVEK